MTYNFILLNYETVIQRYQQLYDEHFECYDKQYFICNIRSGFQNKVCWQTVHIFCY